ncbi:MAG: hypothetical protein A2503_04635 [Burkholderiales bacterium RIFOXYD12_FULL_59_19]|nr:MAG: hypothetical protein A2503_04635 [Burkholderiales bacterium RIFOXYD12_FULL_59_19]
MNNMQTSCDRLAQSRDRLRQALSQAARPGDDSPAPPFGDTAAEVWAKLKGTTSAHIFTTVLKNWWYQHPLRLALQMSAQTAEMVATPVAQRHPIALVVGAGLAGALLVRTRAWRWLSVSAVFAGLTPQLIKALSTQQKA